MSKNPLIRAFCSIEGLVLPMFHDDELYLEMGRVQEMGFLSGNYPSKASVARDGMYAFPRYKTVSQVTIRAIYLSEDLQGKGYFRDFIRYLLVERELAVQLECVQNKSLQSRLIASPLWIAQSSLENRFGYPSFVRFTDPKSDQTKQFSLFGRGD